MENNPFGNRYMQRKLSFGGFFTDTTWAKSLHSSVSEITYGLTHASFSVFSFSSTPTPTRMVITTHPEVANICPWLVPFFWTRNRCTIYWSLIVVCCLRETLTSVSPSTHTTYSHCPSLHVILFRIIPALLSRRFSSFKLRSPTPSRPIISPIGRNPIFRICEKLICLIIDKVVFTTPKGRRVP